MSIITTQEKTKALAEKFEQAIQRSAASRGALVTRPRPANWNTLSLEEQRDLEHVEMTRHTLQLGIYEMFDTLAANVKVARYLVCVPSHLARDLYMGSNEVMRLIASNDPDFDRFLLAEYARKNVFTNYQTAPTTRHTALFHQRFNSKEPLPLTIGECYWLFHFSQWLGCTTTPFSNGVAKLLNGDASTIEFREELQADNTQHQMLASWTRAQYQELIAMLHDL